METKLGNFIIRCSDEFFRILRSVLTHFFQIMDEGKITRRFGTWSSMILTIYAIWWCFTFAMVPPPGFTGLDVGAVIAAVMTPVSALTAALMKFNNDGHAASAAIKLAAKQSPVRQAAVDTVASTEVKHKTLKQIEQDDEV